MRVKARMGAFLRAVVAVIAAAVLAFGCLGLAGCGGSKQNAASQQGTSTASVQSTTSSSSTSSAGKASSASSSSKSTKTQSTASSSKSTKAQSSASTSKQTAAIDEDGSYTSKEDVALYIHTYGKLPGNFISKTKARNAGWVSTEGNLDEVCPGKSIGESVFYNDEGKLPDAKGRTWKECDINYSGGRRGAERIVFSNDGLIYYTADHYKTFEQLY